MIPSSINVPLLLANIIRSQYSGSEESEDTMPYKGIWLMTRNMSRVNCKKDPVSLPHPPRTLYTYETLQSCVAYPRPHKFLVEWYFGFRGRDLGEQRSERFDEVEKSYCTQPRDQSRDIYENIQRFVTHSHSWFRWRRNADFTSPEKWLKRERLEMAQKTRWDQMA